MRKVVKKVGRIVHSPRLNLAMGIALMFTAAFEIFDIALEDVFGFEVGAHHGLFLYGLAHVFKFVHHVFDGFEGAEKITVASEIKEHHAGVAHEEGR